MILLRYHGNAVVVRRFLKPHMVMAITEIPPIVTKYRANPKSCHPNRP